MVRRKILFIIPTLDQSGAEKQLALLARSLPTERFEPIVCALTHGGYYADELRAAGVPLYVLGKRHRVDPTVLWRLYRLVKKLKPDLVHTWLFAANCYGRAAAYMAGVPKIVASERCVDSWKRSYQLMIDRRLAGVTAAVTVNSEAVKEFYERAGVDAAKLRVIRNGVEPIAPTTAEPDRRGAPPGTAIILFIGRLWPQKRVQDLIWAADILRVGDRKFQLWIVGDGPRRPYLEKFRDSLDLDGAVRFFGHRTDAADFLAAADVLALPSQFEGSPNVVLEAMTAGKPVVATAIAGMDEAVADGVTGLLSPPRQPIGLAKSLDQLLQDADLRRTMGDAARRRAADLFGTARMTAEHVALYDELLGGK
ncbi:MAG: glycosyltransferase [Planctomycetia bacterium]